MAGYADVAPDRYFTAPIQWMVDNGIVDVDQQGCFAPDSPANRGDTALYVWRLADRPEPNVEHPFGDVTGAELTKAVSWMYSEGVTTGKQIYGGPVFAPDDSLTSAEIATFLHRLEGTPATGDHPFTDITSEWQQQPVAWFYNQGIHHRHQSHYVPSQRARHAWPVSHFPLPLQGRAYRHRQPRRR